MDYKPNSYYILLGICILFLIIGISAIIYGSYDASQQKEIRQLEAQHYQEELDKIPERLNTWYYIDRTNDLAVYEFNPKYDSSKTCIVAVDGNNLSIYCDKGEK